MDTELLVDKLRRVPREQLNAVTLEQLRKAEQIGGRTVSVYEFPDGQILIFGHRGSEPTRDELRRAVEACLAGEGRA